MTVPPARAYSTTLRQRGACLRLAKSAVVMRIVLGMREVILVEASVGEVEWITVARDFKAESM